jgi:hypothetical protein
MVPALPRSRVRLLALLALAASVPLVVTHWGFAPQFVGAPVVLRPVDEAGLGTENTEGSPPDFLDRGSAQQRGNDTQARKGDPGTKRGVSSWKFANGAANQAPPVPRVPLFAASESDVARGAGRVFVDTASTSPLRRRGEDASASRCWNNDGEAVGVPRWAVGFFEQIPTEGHYAALAAATDDDPWAVLLAWVPQRFMAPQPQGRNAAGDVIKAPTRGRDPNFYLNEYNSTWHATADAASMPYHYQLVHRNALAVCVRERLHMTALRCVPRAGLAPALLHHCLCRKCSEAISHPAKPEFPRYPGWTSIKSYIPLILPKAMIDANPFLSQKPRVIAGLTKRGPNAPKQTNLPQYSGACVQALSAPWLVDRATLPSFAYEGLATDLNALLKVQADEHGIVLVAMFNQFWIDHLHNFYFSMVRRARLTNIIIATLDRESQQLCEANRLPCFDAVEYSELEEDMQVGGAGFLAGATRKVTENMSWIKPRLATAVIERGYGFFMVDLDMTWNAWPMRDVLDVGTDLTHQCDADSHTSINSGFYLAKPNVRTWIYFNNMMLFRPDENSDQTAMKLFARYDHTHGLSHACLDKWQFNMKCNYKRPNSVKKKGRVQSFEWVPFERNRTKFFWKILHATCINGAYAKMLYLRTMNAWFLDDLDALTKAPQGYCLLMPDGTISTGHRSTTKHSKVYSDKTDDTYLASRH